MSTANTIQLLKDAGEDFEWYPTTDRIIRTVAHDINGISYHSRAKSILDIGAGDGRVLTAIRETLDEYIELFAIEKATPHLSAMPKAINIVGTDFLQQTLADKPVDVVFCNPPYSQFEAWTLRILREASAQYVYLVIPQRWKESAAINTSIEDRGAKVTTLGEFDFLDGDRAARAKVEIVKVSFAWGSTNAFDSVIEDMLPELDIFTRGDVEDDAPPAVNVVIESSENVVESLVMAYDSELEKLLANYKAALQIDLDVMKELGVDKASILKGIRQRISGLKNKYWRALFDKIDTVSKRLATKQREAFLTKLSAKVSIDFTESNVYAILIWVSKWANDYYDDQLVDLFKTLSTDSNVVKYKSNQRVWTQGDWRYNSETENAASHYRLEYRLVISHGGICQGYEFQRRQYNGLEERAHNLLRDIVTVANNLGFKCDDTPANYTWESNQQNTLKLSNGQPLAAVRAYKNGNLHIHFSPAVMLAINVEAGRILGWIRNPAQACDELKATGKQAAAVTAIFGKSFRIAPDAGLKLGHTPAEEQPPELDEIPEPAPAPKPRRQPPTPAAPPAADVAARIAQLQAHAKQMQLY